MRAYMNWSGGKDSALALYKALKDPSLQVNALLTNVNSAYDRISMHGVSRSLLELQAEAIGIPLQTIELPEEPSMTEYEKAMFEKVTSLKREGYDKAIFGDIFLEDLKLYREQQLSKAGIDCVFPLWKVDTSELIKEFITLGFKTIVVCVNEKYLDKSFCGRIIDEALIKDLPKNVDPCGENGEFHTFVFEGPLFKNPIPIIKGEITYRKYKSPKNTNDNCFQPTVVEDYGFYFCDLLPA
jgi:uncharacterized protein (TIGR00290 family)